MSAPIRIEKTGYSERQWSHTWAQPSRRVYRGSDPVGCITLWNEADPQVSEGFKTARWLVELDGCEPAFFSWYGSGIAKAERYARQELRGELELTDADLLHHPVQSATLRLRRGPQESWQVWVGRRQIGDIQREKRGSWVLNSRGLVHERFHTLPQAKRYVRREWAPCFAPRQRASERGS